MLGRMQKTLLSLILAAAFASGCSSPSEQPATAKSEPQSMPALLVKPAAQPEPAPVAQGDARAERLATLMKEQQKAMDDYFKAFEEALGGNQNPSREELEKVQAQVKDPDTTVYLARAQQLLDEDPKDITAFNTIRWMMDVARDPASLKTSIGLLEKYHFERPEMGALCARLTADGRGLLEKLLASSPHVDVRGQACFALAELLKQDIQYSEYLRTAKPEDLEGLKGWMGAERTEALGKLDVAATQKEIEKIYDRIVAEFGEVKINVGTKRETTLGKRAGAALYEIRNLAVGQQAPEIEGTDLDSVAFKLSDYRGKVVLLDFWGNW